MKAPVLTLGQAAERAALERAAGRTVAVANGAFDLLHVGHVRYLQAAREISDFLIVAINSDASVRLSKGPDRPVVPQAERVELVASLACVDAVLMFEEKDVVRVLQAIQPHLHVKGTDYSVDTVPERHVLSAWGGRVAIAGDPKDHSTTALVDRLARLDAKRDER